MSCAKCKSDGKPNRLHYNKVIFDIDDGLEFPTMVSSVWKWSQFSRSIIGPSERSMID